MFLVVALLFPIALLLATLGMERVERPLGQDQTRIELERYLDAAELDVRPEDVETLVAEGYGQTLTRYWFRRRRREGTAHNVGARRRDRTHPGR